MGFSGGGIGTIDINQLAANVISGLQIKLVETKTLTAAGTTFNFTGLTDDNEYILIWNITEDNVAAKYCTFAVNGDTTATNYYTQYYGVSATVLTAARTNAANILNRIEQNTSAHGITFIKKNPQGYLSAITESESDGAAAVGYFHSAIKKTGTIASITQLTFTCTGNMKIGSTASLYKINS